MTRDVASLIEEIKRLEALGEVTFYQVFRYALVFKCSGVREAARQLGGDNAAVSRSIDRLQDHFVEAIEKPLFEQTERGRPIELTAAGERVANMCDDILQVVIRTYKELKDSPEYPVVKIGLASFTDKLFEDIWRYVIPKPRQHLLRRCLERNHVNAGDIFKAVQQKGVDFCVGPVLAKARAELSVPTDVECLQLAVDEIGLLSSYEMPPTIRCQDVCAKKLPLIAPNEGVASDILEKLFGETYHSRLNIIERCNNARFTLNTLHSGELGGVSMIASRSMYEEEKTRSGSAHIHFTRFTDSPFVFVLCAVRRSGRKRVEGRSIVDVLWQACVEYHRDHGC
jgi:DNA-binding transcriptional LysR family regulator